MPAFYRGLEAYLLAGALFGLMAFLAYLLAWGLLLWDHRTHFTVDAKGLTVQDTYIKGIRGRPLTIKRSQIVRTYSNIGSKFPYFFIVYMREGKKRFVGLDKSNLSDYKQFLYALMEMAPAVNSGTWRYWDVKDAEKAAH